METEYLPKRQQPEQMAENSSTQRENIAPGDELQIAATQNTKKCTSSTKIKINLTPKRRNEPHLKKTEITKDR